MALRYCVYKDCHNYFNMFDRSYSKENVTFFQFPKDPQRRQKWLQLGKAQPKLPASLYFYCSDHFDDKYKSERHRRTRLVGEAVPYPHASLSVNVQTEVVDSERYETDELPNEYYTYEEVADNCSTVVEQQQNQELQVESTTMSDDDIIELVRSAIDSDDDLLQMNDKDLDETRTLNKCTNKRKAPSTTSSASSLTSNAKILKSFTLSQPPSTVIGSGILKKNISLLLPVANDNVKCHRPYLPVDFVDHGIKESFDINQQNNAHMEGVTCETVQKEEQDIDPESLVDCKQVTTFIFKGEEYVQMPKDYYIKEKMELMQKLQKMESVIENIKKQLNNL